MYLNTHGFELHGTLVLHDGALFASFNTVVVVMLVVILVVTVTSLRLGEWLFLGLRICS